VSLGSLALPLEPHEVTSKYVTTRAITVMSPAMPYNIRVTASGLGSSFFSVHPPKPVVPPVEGGGGGDGGSKESEEKEHVALLLSGHCLFFSTSSRHGVFSVTRPVCAGKLVGLLKACKFDRIPPMTEYPHLPVLHE